MSSCWQVVSRKSSFTSSLHTCTLPCSQPLLRTPPTEGSLCPSHNSKSVLDHPWPKRKPLPLEKTSNLLESRAS